MPDLTPFPDGVGYMDHAWNSLNELQRHWLLTETGRSAIKKPTLARLVRMGLLTEDRETTPRGAALVRWATEDPDA